MERYEAVAASMFLFALMIQSPIISIAIPSNSVTVSVTPSTVSAGYGFTVSGRATTASGNVSGTAVSIRVAAPNGTTVASALVPVVGRGSHGIYSQTMTTAPAWQPGDYAVNATYVPNGVPVSNSTSFELVLPS